MNKIILAITGASGSIYAKIMLDELQKATSQFESLGIVMTDNAKTVWQTELQNEDYKNYPFQFYSKGDFNAPFASGSANYNVMIIAPCSMGTMGRIATGMSNDLITRAADVILKERRRLICVVRETPYNLIHIRNMETITLAGGIICPATPSFYSRPQTLEEVAATVSHRALDLAGIQTKTFRWGESEDQKSS